MTTGDALYRLQQLDSERDAARDRLGEIQAALKDDTLLRQARRALEEKEQRARKWQATQRDLELEMESLADKSARSEGRLYGGKVTNPKELTDLEAEIASLKRRRRALEDQLLEAMIEREGAEESRDGAQESLQETESTWSTTQADLRAERGALEQRLQEVEGRRDRIAARLDPQTLAAYHRLRELKGGQAVAPLRGDTCTVCGVTISASAEWQLRQGELIHCDSCGRIIVSI